MGYLHYIYKSISLQPKMQSKREPGKNFDIQKCFLHALLTFREQCIMINKGSFPGLYDERAYFENLVPDGMTGPRESTPGEFIHSSPQTAKIV